MMNSDDGVMSALTGAVAAGRVCCHCRLDSVLEFPLVQTAVEDIEIGQIVTRLALVGYTLGIDAILYLC